MCYIVIKKHAESLTSIHEAVIIAIKVSYTEPSIYVNAGITFIS